MSELRVALLIISVAFLATLSWWEWRRPRQARAGDAPRRPPREPEAPAPPPRSATESALLLPEIRPHEPLGRHELPVVELHPEEAVDAPAADHAARELPGVLSPELPPELPPELAPELAPELPEEQPSELAAGLPPELPAALPAELAALPPELAAAPPEDASDEDVTVPVAEEPSRAAATARAPEVDSVPEHTPAPHEEVPRLPAAPAPVVDWPPDTERRIVSLRLVATSPERFVGRSLRQALAAEGFVLGRFAIFHKPDEEQRAVLSAASLNRPGTFDADTMDSQRFGGLSLFAVLPGPRPAAQAFEELISTARNLNDRLQGALQDERGSPLTTARIALLRERVNSGSPS